MTSQRLCTFGMMCMLCYLFIILVPFIALCAYAFYSFHIFIPNPPSYNINCPAMLNSSSADYEMYIENRTVLESTPPDRSCFQIKKRRYLPMDMPKSIAGFHNMCFIRIVTKDYDFIEEVLAIMHSPIQFYCYALDVTADEELQKRMFFLGDCLMNILVIRELFDTSTSHGMLKAHHACLQALNDFEWKHAMITAERDVPLQSTKFLSRRARRMRDAVEINGITFNEEDFLKSKPNDTTTQLYRVTRNWLQHLGSVATISHSLHQILYDYLLATPDFKLPTENHRETIVKEPNCESNRYDIDGSCIYAMETFPKIRNLTRLFIRADGHFDFGFLHCLHEMVFDRTFREPISNTNANNYLWGSADSHV